jgi:hypothetical protein
MTEIIDEEGTIITQVYDGGNRVRCHRCGYSVAQIIYNHIEEEEEEEEE